ncbi:succinate dehydrogenase, cytochrome b556 subunit [Pollutimonas nitritireducens]|uniref:Succinate dehydrogenase cytochrome b556 subunit n=1 Tax=Pollutimonas nitritireducens TaxID=2045209 RepID=A0A2N4UGH3_9BURK|nr:succinate dehydrogenase, cytochrome b556 subunit [Pollutimonas nitritireducens]PLC54122.1 succinate dehydrogenase, cytochrome b556 subunit [Pollutimonas nitritireducens]
MQRPVFFNVFQIQMPIGAITSIIHRVTGILLAIGIPFSIYLLDLSLDGPDAYQQAMALLDSLPIRCLAILFAWALGHHLLAGVRHLLSDIDIGSRLAGARRSAWIVNCISPLLAVLAAVAFL